MASGLDHAESVRAVRQLRRIRVFYAAAAGAWAAVAVWAGREAPGSRQMWVSVMFLVLFTALLSTTCLWLRRGQTAAPAEPVHHAAPRRTGWRRHASA
ncbi:hypothetical protein [Streptomyces griseosporeus]|uniref:hypothetical protein n=1 Tax=Streptomyces griseosporeus TaxID=1910 RepID=UPI00167C6411|nr:hypothetical protein [Streptomyces griseosporeus]